MKHNDTQALGVSQDISAPGSESQLLATHKTKILAAIVVVHVIATLFFFPPQEIFNTRPIITLDHAFHYYQVRRAGEIFWDTGRLHAYDPYFMAGFPSAIFDLDVKAAELFCSPFRGEASAVAFKVFILLCYLTIVPTVYKGCRYLGWSEREALFAVLLTLVFWHWGRPYASHFRYAGMFNFILVSHLAILVIGLFRQFLFDKNTVWFFVFGTLVFFVHPTAAVLLVVPLSVLIVLKRRRLTFGRTTLLFLWCVCVLMLNAVWVVPFFEYVGIKTASNAYFQTAGLTGLRCELLRPGCLPALALLALLVPGVLWSRRRRDRSGCAAMIAGVAFLFVLTAYGVRIPGFKQLEPGRFLLPAIFFATPIAGCGLAGLVALLGRRVAPRVFDAAAIGGLLLAAVCFSYLSARTAYNHRLFTTPSADVQELLDAVMANVDRTARVMVEDGPAALYDEAHLPGIIPALTGVEQIGGPYPFTFIAHHFATFERAKTMGRPLSSLTPTQFIAYLDLYNVGWVVTATPEGNEFVSRLRSTRWATPGQAPSPEDGGFADIIWSSRRYTLWRLNRPRRFTDNPGDRVRASYNRIEIELDTIPEQFLLRYHWDDRLTVTPPATVNKVYHLDDPVPFILVEPNGASSIAIKY
ncbi:MAG: hypothetical protein JSW50_11835 [Candidatus Latescibacterota bacterium]|nr:MAG: hypothetical protein JSW50_11835 [Candidatus Latescibacterota bacterium]